MRKKMRFLGVAILFLFTFEAAIKAQILNPKTVDKGQVINPKAEIVSSSEKIVKGAPFSAEAVSESVQILFDGNRITQSVKTRLYRDSEGRFRREEMPKPVGIGSFLDMPQVIFIFDPVSSIKFYLYPESKTARQFELKGEKTEKQKLFERSEWNLKKKSEWEITKTEQEIARTEQEIEKAEQEIANAKEEYEEVRRDFEKRQKQPGFQETAKDRLNLERRKQQIENREARLETLKQQLKKRRQRLESRKAETQNPQTPGEKQIPKQTASESINESSSSNSSSVSVNGKPAKEATQSKTVKKETKTNQAKISAEPNQSKNPSPPVLPKGAVKTESLGTRRLEGVEAEGVRLTTTVAAGAIGNERPIEIVYERWYSKELELIVFSKYTDPRFGEQTYRLVNVKRDEPDSALFTLPADYKIVPEPEKRITVPRKKSART
jgi:hypothetical protein